jgi:outer membrane protein assembly factor BamB
MLKFKLLSPMLSQHFRHFLLLVYIVPISVFSQLPTWNNGGGNAQRNGFSNVNGPITDSVAWQITAPGVFGTPIFVEGNHLVTMRFLSPVNAPVECYDLNNGNLLWSIDVTNAAGRSLPVGLRDERVFVVRYTESLNDTLYALDVSDGSILWTSNVNVAPYITETAVFDTSGYLYIGGNLKTYKINPLNGQMIWQTTTVPMASGSGEMAINNSNSTGYTLEQNGGISYLWAIDLLTGTKKYSIVINELQPGGNVPQSPLMVGFDGTVYVQLTEDNVAAVEDDGIQFNIIWQKEIYGNCAFSQMCVGVDGSVYAPTDGKVIRFNPITGDTLNLTPSLTQGGFYSPRISAAANGMIYLTNGENYVYAFDTSLTLLWSDVLPNTNTSGVCLTQGGYAAVAGLNIIRLYAPSLSTGEPETTPAIIGIFPNPFHSEITVAVNENSLHKDFICTDVYGKVVYKGEFSSLYTRIDTGFLSTGIYTLFIPETGQMYRIVKN